MSKSDEYAAKARDAGAKVRSIVDNATGEVSEISETVEARIHEKPVQSTLVALAAGFVLGMLFRRR